MPSMTWCTYIFVKGIFTRVHKMYDTLCSFNVGSYAFDSITFLLAITLPCMFICIY